MTTITITVPDDLLAGVADDPQSRDRGRQLKEEFRRLVVKFFETHRTSGAAGSSSAAIDVLVQGGESGQPVLFQVKDAARLPLEPAEAERHYQTLGRWKGPSAAEAVQAEARDYWGARGVAGAHWLVARLRSETHAERLHWAASTLAGLGEAALPPVLDALRGESPRDQAVALLHALGWMAERLTTTDPVAELVLVKHLLDEDPDTREAASRALRVLPPERARTWLMRRNADETDPEVRRTIQEELDLIRARGD